VAWQFIVETGGVLLGLSYRMGNLRHILPTLLHDWANCLLLWVKHEISRLLHLKAGMLHRELGMLVLDLRMRNLHWCTIREWGSDKLTGRRKVGLGIACRMLAQETHLALVIVLHFLQLILNDDGLVN
jgi:hypothetical protein